MKNTLFALLSMAVIFSACSEDGGNTADGSTTTDNNATPTTVNNTETANATPEANVDPATLPVMSFEEEEFNWAPAVTAGDVVEHTFKFTNTGKSDLVLSNAKASCGCTVPSWPREPIAPGASGEIKVSFNSKGKSGKQRKSITITANTQPNTKVLYIQGDVNPAEGEAAAKPVPAPAN